MEVMVSTALSVCADSNRSKAEKSRIHEFRLEDCFSKLLMIKKQSIIFCNQCQKRLILSESVFSDEKCLAESDEFFDLQRRKLIAQGVPQAFVF